VYASISAGVTVDVWFATITISVSLGASIHVTGPKYHGEVSFDVDGGADRRLGATAASRSTSTTRRSCASTGEAADGSARALSPSPAAVR